MVKERVYENRVWLPRGDVGRLAERLGVMRKTVTRVIACKVSSWTEHTERVRAELKRIGKCPSCYEADDPDKRWRPW